LPWGRKGFTPPITAPAVSGRETSRARDLSPWEAEP
jgi:hypothetical protein